MRKEFISGMGVSSTSKFGKFWMTDFLPFGVAVIFVFQIMQFFFSNTRLQCFLALVYNWRKNDLLPLMIMSFVFCFYWVRFPVGIYLFKGSDKNTTVMCEIYQKLTVNAPERDVKRCSKIKKNSIHKYITPSIYNINY